MTGTVSEFSAVRLVRGAESQKWENFVCSLSADGATILIGSHSFPATNSTVEVRRNRAVKKVEILRVDGAAVLSLAEKD